MSLTYYGNASGTFVTKHVVVLKHNKTTNTVTIRDDNDFMEVDLASREVLWATGRIGERLNKKGSFHVAYWIPTYVGVGDVVKVSVQDFGVVDSAVLSVDGKPVEAWKLYVSYESVDGAGTPVTGKETRYYEKNTGLWIGTSWAEFYEDGRVAGNYGVHLESSNVPLSK
jgi:hypothetical protein